MNLSQGYILGGKDVYSYAPYQKSSFDSCVARNTAPNGHPIECHEWYRQPVPEKGLHEILSVSTSVPSLMNRASTITLWMSNQHV